MPVSPQKTGYAADLAALECRADALSDAVSDALRSVVRDPTAVRACGRKLGINKNLSSKLVHIARATDLSTILSAMPGQRGWRKIVAAFAAAHGDPDRLAALESAIGDFDAEIERRRIDRRTLATMAGGGLDSPRSRDEHRRLRARAVQDTAAVLGTKADVNALIYLLAPSGRDDDSIDIIAVASMYGLHRLGPGPNLQVHLAATAYRHDVESPVVGERLGAGMTDSHLLEDWSSPGAAAELVVRDGEGIQSIFFAGGGTSRACAIDIAFLEWLPSAAYVHARHEREIGTFGMPVSVPSDWLVLEVLVDRRIPLHEVPEAAAYSQIGGPPARNHWSEAQRLPMTEPVRSGLDAGLPDSLDGIRERHRDVRRIAAEQIGRTISDFTTHLVAIPSPVLSSNVMLRWRLPEPPGGFRR